MAPSCPPDRSRLGALGATKSVRRRGPCLGCDPVAPDRSHVPSPVREGCRSSGPASFLTDWCVPAGPNLPLRLVGLRARSLPVTFAPFGERMMRPSKDQVKHSFRRPQGYPQDSWFVPRNLQMSTGCSQRCPHSPTARGPREGRWSAPARRPPRSRRGTDRRRRAPAGPWSNVVRHGSPRARSGQAAKAFAFSESNSACVIAPVSSSLWACAICSAAPLPPAVPAV